MRQKEATAKQSARRAMAWHEYGSGFAAWLFAFVVYFLCIGKLIDGVLPAEAKSGIAVMAIVLVSAILSFVTGALWRRRARRVPALPPTDEPAEQAIPARGGKINVLEVYFFEDRGFARRPFKHIGFKIDGRELKDIAEWKCGRSFDLVEVSDVEPLDRELLGQPTWYWYDDGRVILLASGCCHELLCDPLSVRITVEDDRVIWHDFAGNPEFTKYPQLGPFVFDRKQYEEAIANPSMKA